MSNSTNRIILTPNIDRHGPLILDVAGHFRLRADVVRAMVLQESSGDEFAFRFEKAYYDKYLRGMLLAYGPLAACSYGLLQIMLQTATEHGFEDRPETLFLPKVGLTWGAIYLRWLLDRYSENYEMAIAAYNGGPGAVMHGKPYRTQAYVDAVMAKVSAAAARSWDGGG